MKKSLKSSQRSKNLRKNKKTKKNMKKMKKMKGVDIDYDKDDIKNKFEKNHKLDIKMIKNINISNSDVDYIINENGEEYILPDKINITLRLDAPFTIKSGDQINYQIRLENDKNLYKYTNIQPSTSDLSTLPENCIAIEVKFTLDDLKTYIFPNSDEN